MDNFAHNWYTLGKIRLGKQALGNFTNGNLTLAKSTPVDKKDKFATKIVYVQIKVYPSPKNFTQARIWCLWQIPSLQLHYTNFLLHYATGA